MRYVRTSPLCGTELFDTQRPRLDCSPLPGGPAGGDWPPAGEQLPDMDTFKPVFCDLIGVESDDVREVLASYKQEQEGTGKSIPEIFRSRQFRFQKQQRQKSAGVKPAFSRGW